MIAKFYTDKILSNTEIRVEKALTVLGAAGVTNVTDQISKNKSVVTSNLINSITYSTKDSKSSMLGKTNGQNLSPAEKASVKIGTTVVYAPRVEFGFTDKDSLGRQYNQPAKSFLRTALLNNKAKLQRLFNLMMKTT